MQHSEASRSEEENMESSISALADLQLAGSAKTVTVPDILTPLPQKAYGQHDHIQSASSSVDILYNSHMGRHIVANRDINPGDVLIVEEPFASILEFKFVFTHCSKCLKRSDALIPCKQCDMVMYCSPSCRASAWAMNHKLECCVIPALKTLDLGQNDFLYLPLRMFFNACSMHHDLVGLYRFVKSLEGKNCVQKIKGFDQNGQYRSQDFTQVYNLFYYPDLDQENLLLLILGVACIVNALEVYTDIFSMDSIPDDLSTEKLKEFATGLLLRLFKMVSSNSFRVNELYCLENGHGIVKSPTGAAIYSMASLLNHSCDPNASYTCHSGDVMVVLANRTIKQGEEIFIHYYGPFSHRGTEDRRHYLQRGYRFDCQCTACTNQWPELNNLRTCHNPVCLCTKCKTPLRDKTCSTCQTINNLTKLHENILKMNFKLTDIYQNIALKTSKYDMPELVKLGLTLEHTLQRPNQMFVTYEEFLPYCKCFML